MSNNGRKPDWRFRPEEEEHDIYDLHSATLREPPEPEEGRERPPWWLWTISVLLIFWAGFYVGRYSGEFGPYVHQLQQEEISAAPSDGKTQLDKEKVSGSEVYANVCAACHQPGGEGVPGAFPPLAGSDWVTGDPEIPVRIILHGLAGPVEVQGVSYNAVMPGWGQKLSDSEIASVVNYIRTNWGNSAESIDAGLVQRIRENTAGRDNNWTADELREFME